MLSIVRVNWTQAAGKKLRRAAGDDLAGIAQEVNDGISRLWWCSDDGVEGYIVTRMECIHGQDVLVLVLGEGRGFEPVVEYLLKIVKDRELGFRVHVRNKALVRMFEKHGLKVGEYVMVNDCGR